MPPLNNKYERGNILLMILVAIILLGALTMAISTDSTQQSGILPKQTQNDQINRMMDYANALGGAVQQMAINGETPSTLYSNLSLLQPGQAGFETSPNNLKIYHPLGGGITPMAASSPDSNAVATGYNINAGSSITGVGCAPGAGSCSGGGTFSAGSCSAGTVTAACWPVASTGHIIFTALISSASYCGAINLILTGSSTVPAMSSGTFTTLFNSSTAVAVTSGNCASCVNTPRLCVSNGASSWGFYADLFPPLMATTQ